MTWIVSTLFLAVLAAVCWGVASWAGRKKRAVDAALAAAAEAQTSLRYDPRRGTDAAAVRKWFRAAAYVLLFFIAVGTFASSFTTVSTKNVGIETAFGATSGHLSNGAHMIPPWDSVTEMDAAIQTDSYTDAKGDNGPCLSVRIGNQQTACVSVSIRWRIDPDQADELFQNYRSFDHVRDSLVTRELTAAVNNQFRNYNPLNSVATTNPGDKQNPPLTVLADRVTAQMQREIGGQGVEILNTIIPLVTFDPATQNRINQLQQQFALTRIAEQEKIASVNTSPNVLVAQCFQILGEMVKQGQTVPPAFSCWPGKGTGVSVIAGSTGATK